MLKNINFVEIGFGILGVATLYYTIYYYRFNIAHTKSFKLEVENKIDDLKIQVSDLSSSLEKSEREIEEMKRQQQQNSWM
jgi:cell division protein FtsL